MKNTKLISSLILTLFCGSALSSLPLETCDELNSLHREQLYTLEESYYLARDEGFGIHLAAIAWHESSGGLFTVNMEYSDNSMSANKKTGPSFGPHHVLVINAIAIEGLKDTPWNRSIVAAKLIHNMAYSAKMAIKILEHGKKIRGTEWGTIAYYNAGRHGGDSYAGRVIKTMETMRRCRFAQHLDDLLNY